MNCLAGIVNFILYVVNVVFLVIGILLIVLGSIMLSHINQFTGVANLIDTNTIPICITVLGVLIFVISFFGCCGIFKQSTCMTGTYATMIFILFILELVLTCWVFVNRSAFVRDMTALVNTVWDENTAANDYPMGVLELAFNCCGDISYLDYGNQTIPGTCCGNTNRTATCSSDVYVFKQGCSEKMTEFWEDNTNIIRWSGLGICIFELIVFLLAGALTNCMRQSNSGRNVS
ncbi:23 kDa integral membrane protein-like [Drosophila tropicalis]|uniref:23 kDa integral membrane protein-like n=1 Tax=Drosophila tropicalis TaxID=46794 RepID=UPI0035ABCAAF